MARKTKLTLFDEPEAGIDLWSFQNLINVFEKMHDEIQASILIISHQERILNIADQVVVISGGQISQTGTKEEVLPGLFGIELYTKSCTPASVISAGICTLSSFVPGLM